MRPALPFTVASSLSKCTIVGQAFEPDAIVGQAFEPDVRLESLTYSEFASRVLAIYMVLREVRPRVLLFQGFFGIANSRPTVQAIPCSTSRRNKGDQNDGEKS